MGQTIKRVAAPLAGPRGQSGSVERGQVPAPGQVLTPCVPVCPCALHFLSGPPEKEANTTQRRQLGRSYEKVHFVSLSQLAVTGTKRLGKSNLKHASFIWSPGFSPRLAGSFLSGPVEHAGAGKQRKRDREGTRHTSPGYTPIPHFPSLGPLSPPRHHLGTHVPCGETFDPSHLFLVLESVSQPESPVFSPRLGYEGCLGSEV